MKEDIGLFDAHFFNLSAETAAALDPQFRLQLESTYEALESGTSFLSPGQMNAATDPQNSWYHSSGCGRLQHLGLRRLLLPGLPREFDP